MYACREFILRGLNREYVQLMPHGPLPKLPARVLSPSGARYEKMRK
jgi:hypothetical protein